MASEEGEGEERRLRLLAAKEGGKGVLRQLQNLESGLTSIDEADRRKATGAAAALAEGWAQAGPEPGSKDAETLAEFFASRIEDIACAGQACRGATAVARCRALTAEGADKLLRGALSIEGRFLAAPGRAARLALLAELARWVAEGSAQEASLEQEAGASAGEERDPRSALASIKLAKSLRRLPSDVFDAAAAYFPASVSGTAAKDVPRELLKDELEGVLSRKPERATELAKEALAEGERADDCASLLAASALSFPRAATELAHMAQFGASSSEENLARALRDCPERAREVASCLSSCSSTEGRCRLAWAASAGGPSPATALCATSALRSSLREPRVAVSFARGAVPGAQFGDMGPAMAQAGVEGILAGNLPSREACDGLEALGSARGLSAEAAEALATACLDSEQARRALGPGSAPAVMQAACRMADGSQGVDDVLSRCATADAASREGVMAFACGQEGRPEMLRGCILACGARWEGGGSGIDGAKERAMEAVRKGDGELARALALCASSSEQAQLADGAGQEGAAALLALAGAAEGFAKEGSPDRVKEVVCRLLTKCASMEGDDWQEAAEAGGEVLNEMPEGELAAADDAMTGIERARSCEGRVKAAAWVNAAMARRHGDCERARQLLERELAAFPVAAAAGLAAPVDTAAIGGRLARRAPLSEQRWAQKALESLALAGQGKLDPRGSRLALVWILARVPGPAAAQAVGRSAQDLAPGLEAALEERQGLAEEGLRLVVSLLDGGGQLGPREVGALVLAVGRVCREAKPLAARERAAECLGRLSRLEGAPAHAKDAKRALSCALDDPKRRVRRAASLSLAAWSGLA